MNSAIFLDRDDTLIPDPGYPDDPEAVTLFADTRAALALLREHYPLFLFSNQSGIGRGLYRVDDAIAVNRRMEALIDLPGTLFQAVCMPPERPDQPSRYRKPSPTFILETLARYGYPPDTCWMVGDRLTDLQAGINAGIRAALVRTPLSPAVPELSTYVALHRIPVFESLLAFARWVTALP